VSFNICRSYIGPSLSLSVNNSHGGTHGSEGGDGVRSRNSNCCQLREEEKGDGEYARAVAFS
jgi:hypothetical protein